MTETLEKRKIKSPSNEAGSEDLSFAIKQSVHRLQGEEVRCVRVYGNRYRCNWWVKDGSDAISSVLGRIARSKMLQVTQTPDGLLIEDVTG